MLKVACFLLLILLVNPVADAQEVLVDIGKAKELAGNRKHLEAIKVLAPCLKQPVRVRSKELEECLFQGGSILKDAFSSKNIDLNINLLGEYQKLNLHVTIYLNSPIIMHNKFFSFLAWLFPKSKYMDIAEYDVIGWAYDDLDRILQVASSIEKYMLKYPEGRRIDEASLSLARIYDNLWEDLRAPLYNPNAFKWIKVDGGDVLEIPEGFRESYFYSDNLKQDMKNAEVYREKALDLYKKLFSSQNIGFKSAALERYKELQHREPSHTFYIIND